MRFRDFKRSFLSQPEQQASKAGNDTLADTKKRKTGDAFHTLEKVKDPN